MGDVILGLLVVACGLIILSVLKTFYWLWLKPKRMAKYLKQQGLNGPSYKLFYGNLKEAVMMMMEARSKPMELSHRVVPRLLSFENLMVQTYGKMFVTWQGPTPRVNIMDPNLVRDILSTKFGHFSRLKSTPLGGLLAKGLVSYNGEKWVKHRKIVNPAFHQEKLKMMLPAFDACCSELVTKWEKLVSEEQCEVDIWPYLQNLTADVISRTAFGSSYEEGRRIFELQTEMAERVMQLAGSIYVPGSWYLPTKRNKRMKEIYREVGSLLRDMITKREKGMKSGGVRGDDLLGLFMESNFKEIKDGGSAKNVGMSIDEVIEECKLFYFAGQETTSTLLVWTMVILCMHPEWQEKARVEVLQVFGTRKPDFEGLNQLKIVNMILYEVLRLYPPVCFLTRITHKTMELGKVCLPPGVELGLPILLVHHDPELWGKDADEFNPNRFSQGISKATKNQVSFFPFSWGPQICVGQSFALMEAKMALAMILQKFSFQLSSTYMHAPFTIITIQPQYGAQLMLRKL